MKSRTVGKKLDIPNLIRYEPSGTYFARVRINGKLFRDYLENQGCVSGQDAKPREFGIVVTRNCGHN